MVRTTASVLILLAAATAQTPRPLIDKLVEALDEEDGHRAAAAKLYSLGERSVPKLADIIFGEVVVQNRKKARHIDRQITLLASMPEHSVKLAPKLIMRLRSRNWLPNESQLLDLLLAFAAYPNEEAISALLSGTIVHFETGNGRPQVADPKLTQWTLDSHLPSLLRSVESGSNFHARIAIDRAIPKLEKADSATLNIWIASLSHCAANSRQSSLVPILGGRPRRCFPNANLAASRALLRIAPSHPMTLAALIDTMTKHPSPARRAEAAFSIGQRGDLASGAVPALKTALTHESNPKVIRQVITAAGMLGAKANDLEWLVQEFTTSKDRSIAALARASHRQLQKPLSDRMHWYSHPNGMHKCAGSYRKGVMHGNWTFWAANGSRLSHGEYRDGEPQGMWNTWYANGQQKSVGKYEDGEREGDWSFYYESGTKHSKGIFRSGQKHGNWIFWTATGREIAAQTGKYVDGVRQQ